jgi:hypothetical protein
MCRCLEDRYDRCATHESCDDRDCNALRNPQTVEELREAYEHWMNHGWLSGCSHGA